MTNCQHFETLSKSIRMVRNYQAFVGKCVKVLWVYRYICSRHGGAKKVKMSRFLFVNRSYKKCSKFMKGSQLDQ